jgi:hypothetical protein
MRLGMTNSEKVHSFLKANPHRMICEDCIGEKTGVDRHQVNTIAATLALFPKEFRRMSTACSEKCSTRDKISIEAL